MGVDKDVSHPSECATAGEPNLLQLQPRLEDNRDGPVRPEALHGCRLCDICGLAGCLYGHRAVPCSLRRSSAHHTGVLDGRPEHALSSCFAVTHRLIPVCCGDHRRTSRNLHARYSVLVHRLCLHSGPPHSCTCFHSCVVQTAALQRLPGMMNLFLCLNWISISSYLWCVSFMSYSSHVVLFHSTLSCASTKWCASVAL